MTGLTDPRAIERLTQMNQREQAIPGPPLRHTSAEYFDRMTEALGTDPGTLSPQAQRILVWLAGWDDPTITGIVELLEAARQAG